MNNEEKQEELKVAISDFIWEYELGKIGFGECVNRISQFILSREEKQKQRMKERLEELREFQPSGSGDCTSCGSYMGSGEHYCKEMMKNEVIDEIVDLLEE